MHEFVQAAKICDQVLAGPKMQMIGVRENNLRAKIFEIMRVQTFDRCLRADRHKDRRLYVAVRCVENAGAGLTVGRFVSNLVQHRNTRMKRE